MHDVAMTTNIYVYLCHDPMVREGMTIWPMRTVPYRFYAHEQFPILLLVYIYGAPQQGSKFVKCVPSTKPQLLLLAKLTIVSNHTSI